MINVMSSLQPFHRVDSVFAHRTRRRKSIRISPVKSVTGASAKLIGSFDGSIDENHKGFAGISVAAAWKMVQVKREMVDESTQYEEQYFPLNKRAKVVASAEKLLLRDADADYGGVDDMTKLAYLNEPGVLDNLKKRYALNEICKMRAISVKHVITF